MGRTNPSAANNTAAFSQLQAENDALKRKTGICARSSSE